MPTIEDIKSLVARRGGFARPNRYYVDVSGLRTILSNEYTESVKDLNFLVDSITMPGKQITTFDYAIWNHSIKIPSGYVEDDIEIVFNVTNDFSSKRIMDAWLATVINQQSYSFAYDANYKADIKIYQMDENDRTRFGLWIKGAYPTSVKGGLLDNSSESAISKFSATLTYNRFDPIPQSELNI